MANEILLSRIHPDYAEIRAQFQLASQGRGTWTDLLPTAVGQNLIDFFAAIGELDQWSIEHAYREAFITAKKDSSIFAIAKLLSTRLSRKRPATATVTLTRESTVAQLTIPRYSKFTGGGYTLFNREPIVFEIGDDEVTATVYEGVVKTVSNVLSNGQDFQVFTSSEEDFQVSDVDTYVIVNSVSVPVNTGGLWLLRDTAGVYDGTTAKGGLELIFGSAEFGTKPAVNAPITISYVVTTGVSGNSAAFNGQEIVYSNDATVTGVATSALSLGADERDAVFYKRYGPQLYAAGERATNKEEYRAIAAKYPGVKDALVVGQRELSPSNNAFMNLVRVSLLTTTTPSTEQKEAFTAYFQERTMYPVRFYHQDPVALPVAITGDVYCSPSSNLNEVKAKIITALTALFEPRAGIIGMNFFRSDIHNVIKMADAGVRFVQLVSPAVDVYPMLQFPKLPRLTVTPSGGSLTGVVAYAVTAQNASGETLATKLVATTLGGASSVTVIWDLLQGATGYKVYGRTSGSTLLMTTLGPTVSSFTDTGVITPSGAPPSLDTSGVVYCSLGTVTLTMHHTDRSL